MGGNGKCTRQDLQKEAIMRTLEEAAKPDEHDFEPLSSWDKVWITAISVLAFCTGSVLVWLVIRWAVSVGLLR